MILHFLRFGTFLNKVLKIKTFSQHFLKLAQSSDMHVRRIFIINTLNKLICTGNILNWQMFFSENTLKGLDYRQKTNRKDRDFLQCVFKLLKSLFFKYFSLFFFITTPFNLVQHCLFYSPCVRLQQEYQDHHSEEEDGDLYEKIAGTEPARDDNKFTDKRRCEFLRMMSSSWPS